MVALLALRGVLAGLHFLGESRCPDYEAVQQELRLIDPEILEAPVRRFVMVEPQANGLRLRLFDGEGHLLEQRLVVGSKSCSQWAQVSAALISSWQAEFASPTLAPPILPVSPSSPPELPEVASAVPAEPESNSPSAAVAVRADRLEANPPRWEGELGVGLLGAVANKGTVAPGLDILAGLAPFGSHFGGRMTLSIVGSRSFPAESGTANWQRYTLALGGYGALGSTQLKFELGAAFLAGLINAYGTGFPQSASSLSFEPGLGLSTRVRWEFAQGWLAWLQVGAAFWLTSQELPVGTGTTQVFVAQVPPVDLSATVGLSHTLDF